MSATEIFSSGGGTQSSAIAALIVQGRIPKPDVVCIVDTERERSSTWAYLNTVIRPALLSVGLEVHRIQKGEYGSKPAHGMDYLSHNQNTLLVPAFTNQTGEIGKLSGFCSKTWKVETKQRYLRNVLGIPIKKQRNWIGFSTNEARRAVRMMSGKEYLAGLIWFPLIEGIPHTREQSIKLVEDMGWPTPPRSACWMCPNQGDAEWKDLKENHPDEFEKACALEKQIQEKDPFAWLHPSGIPLELVDFSEPEDALADRACSSGGCFT